MRFKQDLKHYSKTIWQISAFLLMGIVASVFILVASFGVKSNYVFAEGENIPLSALSGFTPTGTGDFQLANSGAENSISNPYKIQTEDDLRTLAYWVNTKFEASDSDNLAKQKKYTRASYRLENHLNLSTWNWEPIGTFDNPFLGNFNGNGHSIYGLTIIDDLTQTTSSEETSETYAGLFGLVKYAKEESIEYTPTIQLLGLKDTVIVTNRTYVGAFVALGIGADPNIYGVEKTVSFVTTEETTGNPTYSNAVGALIIEDCYNVGYIQGGMNVGGLAGALLYGAVVFNCYNSPMNKISYNQNYDIYSDSSEANVGGIVGYADYVSQAVVYKCYNSALVSRIDVEELRNSGQESQIASNATITNIGFIIGNKQYIGASTKYSYNIYVKYNYSFKGDYGFGRTLSLINYTIFNAKYFSIQQYDMGTWSNNSSKIWCMQANVNNGLPVLVNVPQLIKYDFKSQDVDGNNVLDSDAYGIFSSETAPVMQDNVNKYYFYEQGTDFFATSNILLKQNYIFKQWDLQYTTDSIKTGTLFTNESSLESTKIFTNHDATIIPVYGFKEYTISLAVNSENYDATNSTIEVENKETVSSNNVATANYTDTVIFSLIANTGFEVYGWNCEFSNALTTSSNIANLSISDYIEAFITAHPSEEIPTSITITALLKAKDYNFILGNYDSSIGALMATSAGVDLGSSNTVTFGSGLELSANVVNDSYEFIGWEINGIVVSQMPTYSFTVGDYDDGQIVVNGIFEKKKYSILLTQAAGGNISVLSPTTGIYYHGDNVVIQATSDYGFYLNRMTLTIDGVAVDWETVDPSKIVLDLDNGTLTINNLDANIACTAVFERVKFNLTVVLSHENGAIVYDGDESNSILGTHEFIYGQYVNLGVTLANGFKLVNIVDNDGQEYLVSHSVQVLKDMTVTINLEHVKFIVQVTLDVKDNTYSLQDDCLTGVGEYIYGSSVLVKINVPEMFEFERWEVLGSAIENSVFDNIHVTFSCSNITQNIILKAYFKLKSVNVVFKAEGLSDDSDWYKVNGTVINSEYCISKQYHSQIDVQLLTNTSVYANFSHWEINGTPVSTLSYYSFLTESDDLIITAIFEPNEYNVTAYVVRWNSDHGNYDNLSYAGTIFGLNSNNIKYGSEINLTAVAKDGYKFVGWYIWDSNSPDARGSKISSENDLNYRVLTNSKIYANFERVSKVIVTMSNANAGTVNGAGEYIVGSVVKVSAKAGNGYKFVDWRENGEVVSTSANYEFTTNRNDRTLTAVFEPIFTISLVTNNDQYGKIIGNTTGKYRENVLLQAVSENNCSFVGWVINDVVVSTSETLNLNLNGNIEVKALFKKNFDWNILIILAGCFLFAVILITGSIAYIKMKEAEPMPVRVLLNSKDDKELLQKGQKRNRYRDVIEPVPTRKNTKANVAPIPVRKITVAPVTHKGELVYKKQKASEEKPTLNTNIIEAEKLNTSESKQKEQTTVQKPASKTQNKSVSKNKSKSNSKKSKKKSK